MCTVSEVNVTPMEAVDILQHTLYLTCLLSPTDRATQEPLEDFSDIFLSLTFLK